MISLQRERLRWLACIGGSLSWSHLMISTREMATVSAVWDVTAGRSHNASVAEAHVTQASHVTPKGRSHNASVAEARDPSREAESLSYLSARCPCWLAGLAFL